MIHISKMSNKRVSHPLEVLSINQFLPQMEVLNINREQEKIELGLV